MTTVFVTYPVTTSEIVWNLHEERNFIVDYVTATAFFALNSLNF